VNRAAIALCSVLLGCSAQPPAPLDPSSSEVVTGCVGGPNSDATGFVVRRNGELLQWFRRGPPPIAIERTEPVRMLTPEQTYSIFNALGEMNFAGIDQQSRGELTCYLALRSESEGVIHEVAWDARRGAPMLVGNLFRRIDDLTRTDGEKKPSS
jgi:hypothetical protein